MEVKEFGWILAKSNKLGKLTLEFLSANLLKMVLSWKESQKYTQELALENICKPKDLEDIVVQVNAEVHWRVEIHQKPFG